MTDLLILLTLHFVGDFLLQSDWMALNKSKSWDALLMHALVYVVPFTVWFMLTNDSPAAVKFLAVTLVAHFLTDAVTSRWTSRLWFIETTMAGSMTRYPNDESTRAMTYFVDVKPTRHWFFVVIGLDQLLHAWQLGLTYWWLVR